MTLNKRYTEFAFVAGFSLQLPLWYRKFFQTVGKDYVHSDSYHWGNIALVAVAMLLMAPILRHGKVGQRILALLLCILPMIVLINYFEFLLGGRLNIPLQPYG